MSSAARIILAVLLLAVVAFCVFGFLATFEPADCSMLGWRIGYAGVGAAALILAVWLLWLAWTRGPRIND